MGHDRDLFGYGDLLLAYATGCVHGAIGALVGLAAITFVLWVT